MQLLDLDPQFLRSKDLRHWRRVRCTPAKADGVIFLCPKCLAANEMRREGVHSIICWTPKVPPEADPKPGRWSFSGAAMDSLTLTASSSSVLVLGGCAAHFFVQNGQIVGC